MGTTFVAGKIGQAVNLDGLDHIEIMPTTQECWIRG